MIQVKVTGLGFELKQSNSQVPVFNGYTTMKLPDIYIESEQSSSSHQSSNSLKHQPKVLGSATAPLLGPAYSFSRPTKLGLGGGCCVASNSSSRRK